MIFSEDLAVDVNQLMKQFSPPYVVPNPSYIRWCLIFFYCMGRYRIK